MEEKQLPAVDKPRPKRNLKDRVPVNGNSRNILTVPHKEPGYIYRWVTNDPDRVARFDEAWWEPDTDPRNRRPGDRKVDTSAGTSSIVETRAGGGRKYVLMRIPKELYAQDKAAKHKAIDEVEAEMVREAKKDRYGRLEIDRSGRVDQPPIGS